MTDVIKRARDTLVQFRESADGGYPCEMVDELACSLREVLVGLEEATHLVERYTNAVGQAGFTVEPLYTEARAFLGRQA